jgi:hypothetical protein
MGHLKIVVKIPDTIYPELVADLERVQLRDRAERIRVLAMIGLRTIQPVVTLQPVSHQATVQPVSHQATVQPPHEEQQTARKMIRNLTDSL